MKRGWIVLGLLIALICYYLPWYTHATAGFTTSAHDLAEWTSLHPATRSSSPELLTTLYLRLPQLMLIAALALAANQFGDERVRWVLRAIALGLVLRFVPPSDFFTTMRDDPNYAQMAQLTLAGVVLVGLAWLMYRVPLRGQAGVLAAVLGVGILAGWLGMADAKTLLDNFEIDVSLGAGIIGYTLAAGGVIVLVIWAAFAESGADRPTAIDAQ